MLTMQARRLLKFLEKQKGRWVSKEEIEGLGIRRHRDRVRELRALGYVIENRCARRRGPKLSEYRLLGRRNGGGGDEEQARVEAGAAAGIFSGERGT